MKDTKYAQLITTHETPYVVFKPWQEQEELIHGFSTKLGGVSEGALFSLNLGFNRGDEIECVKTNYKRLCHSLEIPYEALVLSKQIHETHIEKVGYQERGNGIERLNKWESADGLYTTESGVAIVTHYADCVPLLFYAPQYHIIGSAHAGWRGTVDEIGPQMIRLWTQKENIPVEAIEVVIGPSIGPCCFEVHDDVAQAFRNKFKEQHIVTDLGNDKYKVDLWEYNRRLLIEAGVKPQNIYKSEICTCCEHDTFYSHRYTNGKRGTLGAVMYLRK
ncbi:MAG: peptidoglycan editing factor PgeF [Cellulosilyticaceae bacterium]